MSYLDFLARPYNLVFVGAGVAGLGVLLAGRRSGRDLILLHAGLIAFAVAGLTINGAIHDLRLGDPGGRFPTVVASSAVVAAVSAWAARAVRDRFFPRVHGVRFNERGQEGVRARVVSREVGAEPGSGRAQWHDGDGILHLVSCHSEEGSLRFGSVVRLEEFDDEHGSYRVRSA